MMGFGHRSRNRFLEQLAAYADGELDAAGRAQVESWLAVSPEARQELEALRRVSRSNRKLWQASSGPTPSEASWAKLLTRVQQALAVSPRPAEPTPARRSRLLRLVPLAAAAAVLAFIFLWPASAPNVAPPGGDEEAWAVASDDDVEIVSIQDSDTELLVVGLPPLPDTVVVALASANDVTLENVAADSDGMMPKVLMQPGPNAPMIIAPMAGH
jgi:hypothetical protein